MKKKTIIIGAAALIVIIAVFLVVGGNKVDAGKITIETAKVEKGSVSKTVTATGTLEAITTVDVGTQVSGIVDQIFVDFNSYVKKGQLLARIDTTNLVASLEQTKASLDNAQAELDYQQANYNRLEPLIEKKLISQSDFDQTVYNLNKSKANYASALAQYKKNKINLDYAFIYSPIDGIVLNRAVEAGQTVAASFNTPTLFTIANDLTQMKVEADVAEADIGQVKKGQRVTFKVDAYPDDVFSGEVTEVRLEPVVTNNVVTYTIILSAPNPEFKLMPGMTAETEIYIIEKTDATVVPSKALRFSPDEKLLLSYMKAAGKSEKNSGEMAPPSATNGNLSQNSSSETQKTVWIKRDSMIFPAPVEVGLDNDIKTEILSGLKIGDEVVLSMEEDTGAAIPSTPGSNPFMPKPPRR